MLRGLLYQALVDCASAARETTRIMLLRMKDSSIGN